MLAQMRNLTRNWIARIFLIFIALAMAVTLFQADFVSGLQGMFGPSGPAEVAGKSVTDREVQREFNALLRRAQAQGQAIPRQQAIEAGIPARALEMIIQRRARQAYAERLGVHASNAQAAELIRTLPQVRNEMTGAFDAQAYEAFLADIGYSPAEFEDEMRQSIAADQVVRAIVAGVRAPASYGALLLAYRSERRTVSVAEIPASAIGQIPAPSAAQLQTYYEDNRQRFAVPEFRTATVVVARAADFAARAEVSEAAIREEFERRRAGLSTPERRTFVQIAAPDEAQARQAAERLSRGEDPQAVAAALGLQAVRQEDRAQADVADASVRQAVFGLSTGGPARAVRAQLSPWAAVRLESVTAASAPSLEAVREELRNELALHAGGEAMNTALDEFESARDSGTSLAEAASAAGLQVLTVEPITAEGRTRSGGPAEALLDMPDLIGMIFETPEGEATDFMPEGQGVDALIQVDQVIPATTRPLAEVREVLEQQWLAQERARRLQDAATELAAAVRGGANFLEAARAANARVLARSQTLDRETGERLEDRQFFSLVFGGPAGQVASAVRGDAGAVLLVHVENIERADPAQNAETVERLRQQVSSNLQEGLAAASLAAAVDAANVRRNERRMEQLFPTEEQQQQQQ